MIAEREDEAYIENAVWECLTCGMCRERCPSGVDFNRFILEMRTLLAETKGLKGYRAHDGAIHSWMSMMTAPDLKQNRLDWVDPRHPGGRIRRGRFFYGMRAIFRCLLCRHRGRYAFHRKRQHPPAEFSGHQARSAAE